jgi:hypothetical protein
VDEIHECLTIPDAVQDAARAPTLAGSHPGGKQVSAALQGNRLNPPLLPATGETCAVRKPGRISAQRKQEGRRGPRNKGSKRFARSAIPILLRGPRRPSCFLWAENLADVPPPQSPQGPVKSHAGAIQAIVLGPFSKPRRLHRAHLIAVGTRITARPPHRAVRAAFPHTAPTVGV